MQFALSAATLLFAASGVMASPLARRQAAADTKVRAIFRDDAGLKQEVVFPSVGDSGIAQNAFGLFTTFELDVGTDATSTLRCAVESSRDGQRLFATRGANLDDTFSDATNGEWVFVDGPVEVGTVRCSPDFVANNRNAA